MQVSRFTQVAEELWPLKYAESWDAPGLVAGSKEQNVSKVLLAVDLTEAVVDEAVALGCQLIFTHHPALLKGATTLAEDTYKGSLFVKVLSAGLAVYSAHTNADVAVDGVSDTFAKALGLQSSKPLVETMDGLGHGRVGDLPTPMALGELVRRLVEVLPATVRGVSATASPELLVSKAALCGGAGDAFIADAVKAGADVYITSDLRHHVASEAGVALIDVPHWASESLWLQKAANALGQKLTDVTFFVSQINTDPWVFGHGRGN